MTTDTVEYISYLAQLAIEELKNENLKLNAAQPPTGDEQSLIRLAFQLSSSIRKTCFMVYGHYNGKVRDYVKLAIAQPEPAAVATTQTDEDGMPDTIDLNTEAGRRLLKQLQRTGAIHWPDVRTLIEEES